MTLGGGTAFAKRLPFERYFRDARRHGYGHRPRHCRPQHRHAPSSPSQRKRNRVPEA
jgi:hypothetical protein